MTVKSSLDLKQKIQPCKSKICKACGLYLHQLPAYDNVRTAQVFWVGLSAVQFEDGDEHVPLSPFTRSGALIASVQKPLSEEISFYKTNLVKCVPLNKELDKIRYPLEHEMEKCFPNFEYELDVLSPTVVFLLGKQVASFVMKKMGAKQIELPDNFKYQPIEVAGTFFVPVHHPSFILVYKRKQLDMYINNIQELCKKLVSKKRLKQAV